MKKFATTKIILVGMCILTAFSILTGCGGVFGGGRWDKPVTVNSTVPANAATAVVIGTKLTATFNGTMDPATLTKATFTVTQGATAVSGTVTCSGVTAVFTPAANLTTGLLYTATITTGAKSLEGQSLASNYVWSFTTGAVADNTPPTVIATLPSDLDTGVGTNSSISATFSKAMAPLTINTATFTVKETISGKNVQGTVNPSGISAIFTPSGNLALNTNFTATIKGGIGGVTDLAQPGRALAVDKVWSFTTGAAAAQLNLGLAAPFGIAATAGVKNTGNTTINGNVVLDPGADCNTVAVDAAGGFGLCGGFPPLINGQVISPLFPDAGITSGAIKADLKAAFLSITPPAGPPAAGSLPGATDIAAGTTLGAPTGNALVQGDNLFSQGVYKSITSIMITGDITLDAQNNPNAAFVFQSAQTIGTADGAATPGIHTRIILINGAKASNVFWQAGTSATLGTNSEFQGNILASADITMKTGATSCGRLLAGAFTSGAFVFDNNVVSVPGNVNAPPSCN